MSLKVSMPQWDLPLKITILLNGGQRVQYKNGAKCLAMKDEALMC